MRRIEALLHSQRHEGEISMKISLLLTRSQAIALAVIGLASLLVGAQKSLAESSQSSDSGTYIVPNYYDDPQNPRNNTFGPNNSEIGTFSNPNGLSALELIQRAQFGTLKLDLNEQRQQIDDAALQFKQEQQRRLQQQNKLQSSPMFQITAPQPNSKP